MTCAPWHHLLNPRLGSLRAKKPHGQNGAACSLQIQVEVFGYLTDQVVTRVGLALAAEGEGIGGCPAMRALLLDCTRSGGCGLVRPSIASRIVGLRRLLQTKGAKCPSSDDLRPMRGISRTEALAHLGF